MDARVRVWCAVTMRIAVLLCLLNACSSAPSTPPTDAARNDASALPDAAAQDAATLPDAAVDDAATPTDAATAPDAFTPAVDAGSDAGWACSVVPQEGCSAGLACRLAIIGGRRPGNGPPACESAGPLFTEHELGPTGSCTMYDAATDTIRDRCAAGLFCGTGSGCLRYCDPSGEPCPPLCSGASGCAQRCTTTGLLEGV